MTTAVTTRFIECLQELKESGAIRSFSSFAKDIDIHRQTLNEVIQGRRSVKVEMLEAAVEKYYFNPIYLFTGDGAHFYSPFQKTLEAADNIALIPVKAQAGYSDQMIDPVFQNNLPKFKLPIPKFQNGEFACFEVEGESMFPAYQDGNYVFCSKLDPAYYAHTFKDGKVYVLISSSEVLIKRVENKIFTSKTLILHSDNPSFAPQKMRIDEVREAWKVEALFRTNLPDKIEFDEGIQNSIKELMSRIMN